jgi:hypothetical protein
MQYVIAKFRETDTRTYTYHNDGPDVAAGDVVRVTDRSGDGWKKVWVVGVTDEKPSFPTKPILGLHVETPTELDLGDEVPFITGAAA